MALTKRQNKLITEMIKETASRVVSGRRFRGAKLFEAGPDMQRVEADITNQVRLSFTNKYSDQLADEILQKTTELNNFLWQELIAAGIGGATISDLGYEDSSYINDIIPEDEMSHMQISLHMAVSEAISEYFQELTTSILKNIPSE